MSKNARQWRLQMLWADGGYRGDLINWVKTAFALTLQIVEKLGSKFETHWQSVSHLIDFD